MEKLCAFVNKHSPFDLNSVPIDVRFHVLPAKLYKFFKWRILVRGKQFFCQSVAKHGILTVFNMISSRKSGQKRRQIVFFPRMRARSAFRAYRRIIRGGCNNSTTYRRTVWGNAQPRPETIKKCFFKKIVLKYLKKS